MDLKGWVPIFVPESSYDIYEKHDIDVNKVWLTFKFSNQDLDNIISKMKKPDSIENISVKKVINYHFGLPNKGITHYKYSKHEFVALDTINSICYYFRSRY